MKIKALQIENYRSISNTRIEFKDINIFIGPNNSGKSTILKSLMPIQGEQLKLEDIRFSKNESNITIYVDNDQIEYYKKNNIIDTYRHAYTNIFPCIKYSVGKNIPTKLKITEYYENNYQIKDDTLNVEINPFPQIEPFNIIIPFKANRKVSKFAEEINSSIVKEVRGDFSNIYSKADRILNLDTNEALEFKELIKEITGISLKTFQSPGGKKLGFNLSIYDSIPLESLGDGLSHMVAFLNELCIAKDKIFLIEEPETEIHPKALKILLSIINKKSINNQFFITTHSNIVLTQLASLSNSKVYQTIVEYPDGIPTTEIRKIDTTEERIEALRTLGYELFDYYLWDSWIIFEESSAERLVRQYLIPWFAKKLIGKTRTISANSKDKVEPSFDDFHNIFCYLHLETNYKNKAFVIVDKNAELVIEKLKNKYSTWNKDNFEILSENDFEKYYPSEFQTEVDRILLIKDRQAKRKEKKQLLDLVLKWIEKDENKAKTEFKNSAKFVIDKLKTIESKLYPK